MAYMQGKEFAKAARSLKRALGFNVEFEGTTEARATLATLGGRGTLGSMDRIAHNQER
jgi:hypothetical protein